MKIRTTHPTAIITRMHENKIRIFYPNGNVIQRKNDADVPEEIVLNVNNWIIADAVLPESEGTFCRTVLMTSPKLTGFNRHKKQGFEERCMPMWDLSELKTVHSKVYSGQGDWEETLNCGVGCRGRPCDSAYSGSWERDLLSMLHSGQIKQCMRFDGELSYSSLDNVSGKLVHLVPVDVHTGVLGISISKKNWCVIVGHRGSSWHRCLLVSPRCLPGVSWCLLVSSEPAVFLLGANFQHTRTPRDTLRICPDYIGLTRFPMFTF